MAEVEVIEDADAVKSKVNLNIFDTKSKNN
jgi:hypothetical protein